jgi:hypothetical protein
MEVTRREVGNGVRIREVDPARREPLLAGRSEKR